MYALISCVIFFSSLVFGDAVTLTKERVPLVKQYIAELKSQGKVPRLVIGATSTDHGKDTLGEEWIFASNNIEDKNKDNPRNMYMDFLQEGSMEVIAKEFPNTFQTISFDTDVLTFMRWNLTKAGRKEFGADGVKLIKEMLTQGGQFQMPLHINLYETKEATIKTLEDYIERNRDSIFSDKFVFMTLDVSNELDHRERQFNQETGEFYTLSKKEQENRKAERNKIEDYVKENNFKRIITQVFGKGNVEVKENAFLEAHGFEVDYLIIATKR